MEKNVILSLFYFINYRGEPAQQPFNAGEKETLCKTGGKEGGKRGKHYTTTFYKNQSNRMRIGTISHLMNHRIGKGVGN